MHLASSSHASARIPRACRHTGLSNTQAAAQLRELTGAISIVVRKSAWVGGAPAGPGGETPRAPETPRSAMRRLV